MYRASPSSQNQATSANTIANHSMMSSTNSPSGVNDAVGRGIYGSQLHSTDSMYSDRSVVSDWNHSQLGYQEMLHYNEPPSTNYQLQRSDFGQPPHAPLPGQAHGDSSRPNASSIFESNGDSRMPNQALMYSDPGNASPFAQDHNHSWSNSNLDVGSLHPLHPVPLPPRHTHSAAPALGVGFLHASNSNPSSSAENSPLVSHRALNQVRSSSVATMPTHEHSRQLYLQQRQQIYQQQQQQMYEQQNGSRHASFSSSELSERPSISPILGDRHDGTVSPPTTIGSSSSSENVKLRPSPPVLTASPSEVLPPSSTSARAVELRGKTGVENSKSGSAEATASRPLVSQKELTGKGAATTKAPQQQKYPGAKRGRKPKPPPTAEEARRNREAYLEKNRVAALHSRQRKKVKNGRLESQADELSKRNQQLQQFARDLHVEMMQLRALLARLPQGFGDVEAYLEREAHGGGIPKIMSICGPTLERDYST